MNKIFAHLEPYSDIKLVDYREFFRPHPDGNEKYQIHDKVLHHICFVEDIKMAKLISDSINFYYSSI